MFAGKEHDHSVKVASVHIESIFNDLSFAYRMRKSLYPVVHLRMTLLHRNAKIPKEHATTV